MIRNKDLYILLLGRLITNFGDSIYSIAAALLVYEMSGSTLYSGITLFLTSSTAIVQLILSPILDKINMKKFLIKSQFIQAVLILPIPLLYYFERLNIYHIMFIMPIVSLINQLVYPGQISLLPKILSEDELISANSFMTMAYQGSNAIFDTLSGIMIASLGYMFAFFADSLTFVIAGFLFCFLSKKIAENNISPKNLRDSNFIKEHFIQLKEGLGLFKDSKIFALALGIVFINFSATSISAVLPAFSKNKVFYGIMLGTMGLGVLAGSLFSGLSFFKKFPLGKLYIFGMELVALSWIGVSYFQNNQLASAVLYGFGWFIVGIVNVYAQTMIQITVPKNKLGSAMGTMIGISTLMAPFGALLGGFLGDFFGSSYTILIASIIIISVSFYWNFNKSIKNLPSVNEFNKNF